MSVPYRRAAVFLAGVFVAAGSVLSLAACGTSPAAGSSPTTPGASAATSSAPGSSPTRTAASTGSTSGQGGTESDRLARPVNVCSVLPAAAVASVTGEAIAVAKGNDTLEYKIYDGDYMSSGGTSGLRDSVLAEDAAPGYQAALQAGGAGATQISGLGDKAFSAITGVQALFGNVDITVSNLQSDQAAETLIRSLQPKL